VFVLCPQMHVFICLSIFLSLCQFLFTYLCVHPSINLSLCLSIHYDRSLVCLSYPSVYPFVSPQVPINVCNHSVSLPICPFIHPYVFLAVCLPHSRMSVDSSVCQFICLCDSLSISLSLGALVYRPSQSCRCLFHKTFFSVIFAPDGVTRLKTHRDRTRARTLFFLI